jgi:hypothetical protein
MATELVWANVMRSRVPLVYLDLNTIIYFARALGGHTTVPAGYKELHDAALRAKAEKRAMFPLGEAHLWEIAKITDPRQRGHLADILEILSDYQYLLGRITIAEMEFEAGMADVMGESVISGSLPLLRPTMGQVFGHVGGMRIVDADGKDRSDAVRARMSDAEFDALKAKLNYDFERRILRGPSDEDLVELTADPDYRPEVAIASHQSRVGWELDTERVLNLDPKWRRGRLRDVIAAREIVHEWSELFARLRVARLKSDLPAFDPSDEEMRRFLGSMPHTQVAISMKTRYHMNPRHNWTPNDISDIDAMSVAYAYCEAVFPDKAVGAALLNSKELRGMGTFVPRRPQDLADWLDALPIANTPDLLVPHPLNRTSS